MSLFTSGSPKQLCGKPSDEDATFTVTELVFARSRCRFREFHLRLFALTTCSLGANDSSLSIPLKNAHLRLRPGLPSVVRLQLVYVYDLGSPYEPDITQRGRERRFRRHLHAKRRQRTVALSAGVVHSYVSNDAMLLSIKPDPLLNESSEVPTVL